MILLYTGKDIMKLKELMRESNINKPVGMANIVSAVYGLDGYHIWIGNRENSGSHGKRIKVNLGGRFDRSNFAAFGFDDRINADVKYHGNMKKHELSDSEKAKIKGWIDSNAMVLLQFWNMEISDAELRAQLKPSRR